MMDVSYKGKLDVDGIENSKNTDNTSNEEKEKAARERQEKIAKSFFFSSSVADVPSRKFRDFCIHVLCKAGSAKARIGDKTYELTPHTCIVLMNNTGFSWQNFSDDFEISSFFISNDYLSKGSPDTNYNTMGMLSLMDNPIVEMTKEEFDLCLNVGAAIKERLKQTDHLFYEGVLRRAVETLLLDIYNIRSHSVSLHSQGNGNQGIRIFRKFIASLEKGNYRTEREVRWYASQLGITPKYLSEVCINASGHGASYWINRFTTEEIARLLHNPTMSINSIATLMNFSTRSYFSHYVKERLGMTPKDYRLQILGLK